MQVSASDDCNKYLLSLEEDLSFLYEIARKARSRGLDPAREPEPYVARDLAEMVEGLVGPKGVAARIRELAAAKMDKHEMAFVVASDVVHAKFGHTEPEGAAEQAVRTALAIMTGGITAAPIQGIAHVRIKENLDRTRYLAVYFAGPIRSAAGTEQALILVVADYVRRILGLEPYKPTEVEIRRFLEELRLYEREVSRFQYHVSDENLVFALQNLPVEATGTETDRIEVSSYRNLPRVETNRIRAGGLRVVNDGIVGRAQKVLRIVEEKGITGWDWLRKLKQDRRDEGNNDSAYMDDIIAGRPIFAFPSRIGGFRLRYGRSRNTGLAAMGVHPAAMGILGGFLASGTQMRIEGPGKGCVVLPVDMIEPPVVKLSDGSVKRIETYEEAITERERVSEILFLGDLLIAFGEFLENNKPLAPSGYTEEWWAQEVRERIVTKCGGVVGEAAEIAGVDSARLQSITQDPLRMRPSAEEALVLSKKLGLPLHPRFTYFWSDLGFEELKILRRALLRSEVVGEERSNPFVKIPCTDEVKRLLERICVPHTLDGDEVHLGEDGFILRALFRADEPNAQLTHGKSSVETLSYFSSIPIREKALTFVGARMGRPEKAKRRDMSPPVHVLFPVGLSGGSHRNITAAATKGTVQVEIVRRRCSACGTVTFRSTCQNCGGTTTEERVCARCNRVVPVEVCPACKAPAVAYESRDINIGELYNRALTALDRPRLEMVKGVRGLTSASKTPELLEKGLLRAKHDLSVFKDGTIRFDATNAPLTHFKPKEIGTPIGRLRELGYVHDIRGVPLHDEVQMCELKVQDVILPQEAANYLIRACQFVDELLEKVYKLSPYYNVKSKVDLVGQLVLGFAPHTSAAVLGRIIGFSQASVCYAHPLWHNIKRRDCDGDEDAIMMVLDVLLNFSKAYLPAQIGGLMDAPLLLISAVDPFEVDEAQNLDVAPSYPLALYQKTLEHADPKIVAEIVDVVEHRLGRPEQFEGYSFTHETYDINEGNLRSSYTSLGAMSNKLEGQLALAEKLRAVDAKEVARRVLSTHLLPDIAGNLKAFTGQKLRCKKCNAKYRRIPLPGKCCYCGGELLLTVHRKGIEKYLDVAEKTVGRYDLDPYYGQRLDLIRSEIKGLFKETEKPLAGQGKQIKLAEFM